MTYDIQLQPIYEQLSHIKVDDAKKLSDHPWFNRTLSAVNDSLVRLGVFKGEFHWHSHEQEDEFFFVLEGRLDIEIEGQPTAVLMPHEGITIPKGVRHRPLAPQGAVVLMVEKQSIQPTGD